MNRYGVFSEKSSQKYYQLNSKSIFLHIQSALNVMRDFYIICIANVGIFCLSLLWSRIAFPKKENPKTPTFELKSNQAKTKRLAF